MSAYEMLRTQIKYDGEWLQRMMNAMPVIPWQFDADFLLEIMKRKKNFHIMFPIHNSWFFSAKMLTLSFCCLISFSPLCRRVFRAECESTLCGRISVKMEFMKIDLCSKIQQCDQVGDHFFCVFKRSESHLW